VTLDQVQLSMDYVRQHYITQRSQHDGDRVMLESIVTSWYAFDKYYSIIDKTAAYTTAVLLHPNCRKSYLTATWKKNWIAEDITRSTKLWLQYKADKPVLETEAEERPSFEQFLAGVAAKQRCSRGGESDDFSRFIAAPPDHLDITPLEWWLLPLQRRSYPELSRLAIDVLSAPAMSAESERVFSGARRTIPWTRAKLSAPVIEALECLKHWQRSGLVNEEFLEAADSDIELQN